MDLPDIGYHPVLALASLIEDINTTLKHDYGYPQEAVRLYGRPRGWQDQGPQDCRHRVDSRGSESSISSSVLAKGSHSSSTSDLSAKVGTTGPTAVSSAATTAPVPRRLSLPASGTLRDAIRVQRSNERLRQAYELQMSRYLDGCFATLEDVCD